MLGGGGHISHGAQPVSCPTPGLRPPSVRRSGSGGYNFKIEETALYLIISKSSLDVLIQIQDVNCSP